MDKKIIKVDSDKRILIYKKWNSKQWMYHAETQRKWSFLNLFSWWFTSNWGSDDVLVRIPAFYDLERAIKWAEEIKENYLDK